MPVSPESSDLSQPSGMRSTHLLDVLFGYPRLLIVMHDNPDPDAIASGWAVHALIEEKLAKPVRLVAGGAIVRAENRHLVELLSPPIELVDELAADGDFGAILVDCGFGATNHLLTRQGIQPVAVIDHHTSGTAAAMAFADIRPESVATSSIAAGYLREQQFEPGPKLATALLYAIHTETRGCEFHFSPRDKDILPWLTERAEPALMAEIESAPLAREYYGDLVLAMQNTFTYGDAAFCLLPRAHGAEIVGEVADLLVRGRGIRRVFCGAVVGDDLVVSVRTETDADNATDLLRATLAGLGGGGGHEHRAGGKIPGIARDAKISDATEDTLRMRWRSACAVDNRRGTRLIPRREIVGNLTDTVF